MKKVILPALLLALLFAPTFAFAQDALGNIADIVDAIAEIVGMIIPIVFALILVYFFWGLAKFVLNAGDEEARKQGRQMMIWGLVALFVAAAVWGLVEFIGDALDIDVNVDDVSSPSIQNL